MLRTYPSLPECPVRRRTTFSRSSAPILFCRGRSQPPVDSIFTCSFRVEVQFRADACIPPVSLFSKVRTYGIPDFTGSQVGSNGETLWLVDGVTLPAGPARVTRDGTVHRSFKVRAGRSPAIVMHTTIALGLLEPMSDLVLNPVASYFIPAPGTIARIPNFSSIWNVVHTAEDTTGRL